MYLNRQTRKAFEYLLSRRVPEDAYFDIQADRKSTYINFQATTQAAVKAIRAAFPGTVWKKNYATGCKWWEYDGVTPENVHIHIYACTEAPPTCTSTVEIVEVEEQVPVTFETRKVKKEVVRWNCSGDAAEAS